MWTKLENLWNSLQESFLFVPAAICVAAMMLANAMMLIDYIPSADEWTTLLGFEGGPEGARQVLATIAASMITVAGVVYSILMVALTVASSQFGPRLLKTFFRDTISQVAFGVFNGTFIYCLLILRTIRQGENAFVPHLSVTVGIILAVLCMGILVLFINHISLALQAGSVIDHVSRELNVSIKRFCNKCSSQKNVFELTNEEKEQLESVAHSKFTEIPSQARGYIQAIDYEGLVHAAKCHHLTFTVKVIVGDYIIRDQCLLTYQGATDEHEKIVNTVNAAFVFGWERTRGQDIRFPINQLVQLGLRALSPAINDPITGTMVLDRLEEAFVALAEADLPRNYHLDQEKQIRVVARIPSYTELTLSAFNQLRQSGNDNLEFCCRFMEALTAIAKSTKATEFHTALKTQAEAVMEVAQQKLPASTDQKQVEQAYQSFLQTIQG
ncbi:DUF2254 domain-containing protein [Planctomycetales bacterium 10988]|nr:DUF2254 domain-containing protein [Planctomycetales bacterium 10988]